MCIFFSDDVFYLDVENTTDIKLSQQNCTLSFVQCLQVTKPIVKRIRSNDSTIELPQKIICS